MHIVTAYPTYVSGPGWANSPIWIVVMIDGELKELCLQPHEQTVEMQNLFSVCASAHTAMVRAVRAAESGKKSPAKKAIARELSYLTKKSKVT